MSSSGINTTGFNNMRDTSASIHNPANIPDNDYVAIFTNGQEEDEDEYSSAYDSSSEEDEKLEAKVKEVN